MRKGFTMIELIFVIVILAILAVVAIPRLAATRKNADIVAGSQKLANAITDIMAYRVTHVEFAKNLQDMTNQESPLIVEGKECAIFSIDKNLTSVRVKKNLKDEICKSIWDMTNLTNSSRIVADEGQIILQ